jgi:cell wall-associated NlpC family hydrolase
VTKYRIASPAADVREIPDAAAKRGKLETQLVYGEIFKVEEEKDGWCKGRCEHDGYPGYIEKKYLAPLVAPATHIVTAARSHVYGEATMKSPLLHTLGFGSLVAVTVTDEKFAQTDDGGWIYRKHLEPISAPDQDYLSIARKFLETPYYWGGRSGFGMDCSGLVQVCLARAGIAVPRDTELQEAAIGKPAGTPQAGDFVFFPGHVGIMVDGQNLLHANAFHMKVVIEPLKDVIGRDNEITSIRRL